MLELQRSSRGITRGMTSGATESRCVESRGFRDKSEFQLPVNSASHDVLESNIRDGDGGFDHGRNGRREDDRNVRDTHPDGHACDRLRLVSKHLGVKTWRWDLQIV